MTGQTLKLWTTLGSFAVVAAAAQPMLLNSSAFAAPPVAAGEGGEKGASNAVKSDETEADDLGKMLGNILAGEGGEGGAGVPQLKNGSITFPSLSGSQLRKVLAGNSLITSTSTFYFGADGKLQGRENGYHKAAADNCPTASGPNYGRRDGNCYIVNDLIVSGGAWSIKDDTLCLPADIDRIFDGESCGRLAVLVNRIAAFKLDGTLVSMQNLQKGNSSETK